MAGRLGGSLPRFPSQLASKGRSWYVVGLLLRQHCTQFLTLVSASSRTVGTDLLRPEPLSKSSSRYTVLMAASKAAAAAGSGLAGLAA